MGKTTRSKANKEKNQTSRRQTRALSIEENEPVPVSAGLGLYSILGLGFAVLTGLFLSTENALLDLVKSKFKPESGDFQIRSVADIVARAKTLPCEDREGTERCAPMAFRGQCETAPGWMQVMCAASCNSCEMLEDKVRCDPERLGVSKVPAFQPGEMSKMFESIPERFPNLNVTYLMRPPAGPYILKFDNFLSDKEIHSMLDNVGILKRSTDQGAVDPKTGIQEQKVSQGRTSENAWCMGACEQNPDVKAVMKRISDIVQVPQENFESFQMLRYAIGQEYKRHHDMSPSLADRLAGPRILTFFLYLSDVEEGGSTKFTDLNPPIEMMPKKGSAILWPSVLDDNLFAQDPATHHQASPVVKGTKYAANSWIHLFDYKTPNFYGCTGSFS